MAKAWHTTQTPHPQNAQNAIAPWWQRVRATALWWHRALAGGALLSLALLAACSKPTISEQPATIQDTTVPPPFSSPLEPQPPEPVAPEGGTPEALPPPLTDTLVNVALLLPLSGQNATLGTALLDSAQMALYDVADREFTLRPYDTEQAGGAADAAAKALHDGAQLILGPVFGRQVAEVAALASLQRVIVIGFSSDRAVAAPGVFLMGQPPDDAMRAVLAYAHDQGRSTLAALLPGNELGNQIATAVRAAAGSRGDTIAHLDFYDPGRTDFQDIVRRVAEFDQRRSATSFARDSGRTNDQRYRAAQLKTSRRPSYSALVLAEAGERLKSLTPLLPYFDVDDGDVKLLGPPLWADPALSHEPSLIGAWFAAPSPDQRAGFLERFKSAYGYQPPAIASLGYDGVALAAALARLNGAPGLAVDTLAAALSNPSGFTGIDGIFRFGEDGVIERGLAILEITRNGSTVIQPAPASFQTP